jgi:hypothetical protein
MVYHQFSCLWVQMIKNDSQNTIYFCVPVIQNPVTNIGFGAKLKCRYLRNYLIKFGMLTYLTNTSNWCNFA